VAMRLMYAIVNLLPHQLSCCFDSLNLQRPPVMTLKFSRRSGHIQLALALCQPNPIGFSIDNTSVAIGICVKGLRI
jgi:hypothetical protein